MIDALKMGDKHRMVSPADWTTRSNVIIPLSIPDAEPRDLFPQGRTTHCP